MNDDLLYVINIIHRMAFTQKYLWVTLEKSEYPHFISGGAYSAMRNQKVFSL